MSRDLDNLSPLARPLANRTAAATTVVDYLDVETLPVGRSHVFVELIADGLATGVRVPVLVVKGSRPGPVFGLTAALHGNELNGISVIHTVAAELDPQTLAGTFVGVVAANVPGLHLHRREFPDGTDLNRIMPGTAEGSVAQVYAHRLLQRIVGQFDYLLDLHTASFGRINSLYVRADMSDECTATMAYLQRPEIIVHNTTSDRTLRAAAMDMGIPAITLEIGAPQRWQSSYAREAAAGVRRLMAWARLIVDADADLTLEEARDSCEGDGDGPIVCRSSQWLFTDRGGLLEVLPEIRQTVAAGERIATVCDAFGVPFREYVSPHAGIVIGKSTNPVGHTGARILHLGRVADATDPHSF